MKKLLLTVTLILGISVIGLCFIQKSNSSTSIRDYKYEAYCDSIWYADPDYYIDVLVETDEYQQYVTEVGLWLED